MGIRDRYKILLWNRRTPQPKANPTRWKIRSKVAFGPLFSPQQIIFRGLGLILCRKPDYNKPNPTKSLANTQFMCKLSLYQGIERHLARYALLREGQHFLVNHCLSDGRPPHLRNSPTILSLELLSLIHIWRCRRSTLCRSRWSPYH